MPEDLEVDNREPTAKAFETLAAATERFAPTT
jgi:hypothetical protein